MLRRQIFRFAIVGGFATLVHMLIGVTLIHAGWAALTANVLAFGVAFFVSFLGHFGYSFSDQSASFSAALLKFAAVALIGFGINEGLLSILVLNAMVPEALGLVVSTLTAASMTFFLSRIWAFQAKAL